MLIGVCLVGLFTVWNTVQKSADKLINNSSTHTPTPTPTPTPIPNPTIPQYDSKIPFNFTVKTSEQMKGRTSDMQIIYDIEYLANFYKLTKMRFAYFTDLPATIIDYQLVYPTITYGTGQTKGKVIDIKVDSKNFLDLLIFAMPVDSTITTNSNTIIVTAEEKNRVVTEYKKLYS